VGLEKSDADTGQTFAVYGVKPGPYLVLPLLPPLDVRDTFGFAADSFMDPLSWFVTPDRPPTLAVPPRKGSRTARKT